MRVRRRTWRWIWPGLTVALILIGIVASAQVLPTITAGRLEQPTAAGSGQAKFHPHSGRALVGFPYQLKINTHCGLASWGSPDFDGSYWDPLGGSSNGNGNPSPGVGPFDEGTMVLLLNGQAEFTSETGAKFLFSRHTGDKIFTWCW
jgi:hypothetical protein